MRYLHSQTVGDAMGAAYFYHLTDSPLDVALPRLIERARAAGWRVAVQGRDAAQMDQLDKQLWRGDEAGFLPHGRAGGAHDAVQPVLLCAQGEAVGNDAACIMTIGGIDVSAESVAQVERVCILFDGHDPEAVQVARTQWKALTGAGIAAQYWAQDDGKWSKKAESAAA